MAFVELAEFPARQFFEVNICPDESDIALHINPRFIRSGDVNTVVCDYKKGDQWLNRVTGDGFPFQQGAEFTITVAFSPGEFLVTLPDATTIRYPNHFDLCEGIPELLYSLRSNLAAPNEPKLLYTHFESDPLEIGQTLKVTGVPRDGAKFFQVDICNDNGEVVLQINPRFNEEKVSFNTHTGGEWKENKVYKEGFPFKHKEEFTITVLFRGEEFLVTLPGGAKITYPNYLGKDKYTRVTVNGEVNFNKIEIK
ncbi:32 kDa beta-galactoside-binding lectin-like [Neosynchiropus ocellatus]